MTRRPHGAGTVYQHAVTGKWIAQLNLGTDPTTGKRRRLTRSTDTKKAAQAVLKTLEAQYASEVTNPASCETLAAFLRQWLDHEAPSWQPRTIELYRHQAEHHIIPIIGHLPLHDIRPKHVQQMMDRIVASGSVPTANKCRRLLYSALKRAVRWELIDRNPVDAIDPVKEHPQRPKLWTQAEVRTFLRHHVGHRHFAAFYILVTAGLGSAPSSVDT